MKNMYIEERRRPAHWALKQFEECEYAFLAMNGEDGMPYNLPMCDDVDSGTIYFHTALEGLKSDLLEKDGRVCLSCVTSAVRDPGSMTIRYTSAVATGTVHKVTDVPEMVRSMSAFCAKYVPGSPDAQSCAQRMSAGRAIVYRIDVEEMVGKESLHGHDL